MLASLDAMSPAPVTTETIVVDNGSTDDSPSLLAAWQEAQPNRLALNVSQPGKARALNAAIRHARGQWLAFLDDDIVVDARYLMAVAAFISRVDCVAGQGAVLWPPEAATAPELMALLEKFPLVPHCQPPDGQPVRELKGANMVIRRAALTQLGGFDERLGPGAVGWSEDVDLARRIRAKGWQILGLPAAQVTHEIDRSRLTEEYFARHHRIRAQGRYVIEHPSLFGRILPDLVFAWLLYLFARGVRRKYYYKARQIFYGEMLRLAVTGYCLPPPTQSPPTSPPR